MIKEDEVGTLLLLPELFYLYSIFKSHISAKRKVKQKSYNLVPCTQPLFLT